MIARDNRSETQEADDMAILAKDRQEQDTRFIENLFLYQVSTFWILGQTLRNRVMHEPRHFASVVAQACALSPLIFEPQSSQSQPAARL